MIKVWKEKYHRLSLAKKFSFISILTIVISMFVFTVTIQFFFEKSVLKITSDGYKQKFDVASENSQKILGDADKITKVLLTDDVIQNWFLMDSEDSAKLLKLKLQVEKKLDYLDALYPDKQYSSISVFNSRGDMVNSNRIRSVSSIYKNFFKVIKDYDDYENGQGWLDLYQLKIPEYDQKGISCLRYYRDYTSGKIKGYIMIEYRSPLLLSNFNHMKYGKTGSYLISDRNGNMKIKNDENRKEYIGKEPFFKWAVKEQENGKVFEINGERCLVTADVIPRLDWIMMGITPVQELTLQGEKLIKILYLVGLLAVLLCTWISYRLAHSVTRPLTKLAETMERFGKGDLSVSVPVTYQDEIGMLSEEFNKMAGKIQLLVDQVYREQKEKRKSELAALQAQINPHFLYNTLNSVSSLIKMDCPDEAFIMIHAIGMFYRTSLSDGKTLIPIEQEIINIENYIQIQKFRYGSKIEYEIEMDTQIKKEWIVKLTLQPLVENSIYHGVKEMREKGRIEIKGWKEENLIYIEVSDNGVGIPTERMAHILEGSNNGKRYSYGLYNINQRLQLHFGKEYGLKIQSQEGKGTKITVKIPVGTERGGHNEGIYCG